MQSVEEYNANLSNFLKKNEEKIIIISNPINNSNNTSKKPDVSLEEKCLDTSDLFDDSNYDLEIIKKNFLNPLLSWSMLEKLSDFNKWPLGCLGNIIENAMKPEVKASNIEVDIKIFTDYKNKNADHTEIISQENTGNKFLETKENFIRTADKNLFKNFNSGKKEFKFDCLEINDNKNIDSKFNKKSFILSDEGKNINEDEFNSSNIQAMNLANKKLVLLIKDDGKGISANEFNQIIYSFSINEKKEFNFFKYGLSLKTSTIRLCNSLFIISKTESEINIGLISKNIQKKIGSDFMLTPIVNFSYDKKSLNPRSVFYMQTLFFILEEIGFMFSDNIASFIEFLKSFNTGTYIFMYDLRKITSEKNIFDWKISHIEGLCDSYVSLGDFELLFDLENKDIVYNYFDNQIGLRNLIDCSFANYINFLCLNFKSDLNFFLLGKKLRLVNPMNCLYNISHNEENVYIIKHNLKVEEKKQDVKAIMINNSIYKGILFNKTFIEKINKQSSFENVIKLSQSMFNGILLYSNNRLICRLNQNKLGEINYFLKKLAKEHKRLLMKKEIDNKQNMLIDHDFDNNENEKSTKEKNAENIEIRTSSSIDEKELNIFDISGFLELPNRYVTLNNKEVTKISQYKIYNH